MCAHGLLWEFGLDVSMLSPAYEARQRLRLPGGVVDVGPRSCVTFDVEGFCQISGGATDGSVEGFDSALLFVTLRRELRNRVGWDRFPRPRLLDHRRLIGLGGDLQFVVEAE